MGHVTSKRHIGTELVLIGCEYPIRYEIDSFTGVGGGHAREVSAVGVEKNDVATGDKGGEVAQVVHGIETDTGIGGRGGKGGKGGVRWEIRWAFLGFFICLLQISFVQD